LLQSGTIVEGYRIDGVLGEGGMGIVYRATQLSLNRVVALKLLSTEFGDDPGFRTRFQREGQLQAALDHQHIVTVYEAGQTDQGLFLAMRLIEGPTLKDLILRDQLDPRRSLRILAQVAQALDVAHDAGLIHRDIKPQNILIGKGDHVYLADFGLIKAPDESSRLTGTGQFIGTIDYVSPEQIQGDPATAASDIYALSGVLFECLTREVPFPRPNEAATVHAHVMAPPPLVSDHRNDMPKAIDEVIQRGMAKEPSDRPASASDLIREATQAFATVAPSPGGAAQETRLSLPSDEGEPGQPTLPPSGGRDQRTRVPGGAAVATAASVAPVSAGPAEQTRPAGIAATEAPARERSPALPILAGVLAVVAIAAGFLIGHSGSGSSSSGFASFASVGHLQLHYPSGWQLSSTAPAVPGMTFSDPVVLAASASHGQLNAGTVTDAAGPTLLPAAFRARVGSALPAPQPVSLGSIPAYRYSGLRVHGITGAVTVYAAPTTAGVATISCWSTAQPAATFDDTCARVAATLKLVGASPSGLGPSPAYAKALSAALGALGSSTAGALGQLRTAKTPGGQASAAAALSAAYAGAAARLAKTTTPALVQDIHGAILGDLRRVARAYASAATAARANHGSAFASAATAVRSGTTALAQAIARLRGRGYGAAGG
jgi:serine/threonine protein kinase